MFCPQCGSTQNDDLKFCKSCGANLHAVRQAMTTRDVDDKFDWSKTWIADMFMGSEQAVKHQVKLERLRGMTPEAKRLREIKAGVITSSVGLGLMLLLLVFMGGIIASGRVSDAAAEILSRLWIVGVLPLLIGAALIFNGMVISKRGEFPDEEATLPNKLGAPPPENYLSAADTNDLATDGPFSVTDATTRHLHETRRKG